MLWTYRAPGDRADCRRSDSGMVRYPVSLVVFAIGLLSLLLVAAVLLPVRVPLETYAVSRKIASVRDDLEVVRTAMPDSVSFHTPATKRQAHDAVIRATATLSAFGATWPVPGEDRELVSGIREVFVELEQLLFFEDGRDGSGEQAVRLEMLYRRASEGLRDLQDGAAGTAREQVDAEHGRSRILLVVWGASVLLAGLGVLRMERRSHALRERTDSEFVRLQRTVRELNMLSEMMGYINSEVEPDRILESMVIRAQELVRSEAGLILLVDASGKGVSSFVSTLGASDQRSELWLQSGIFDDVLDGSAPVRIEAGEVDRLSACPRGIRNLISVPLISENRVHGVLALLNRRDGDFAQDDEDTLINFAFHAYQAIHLHSEITRMATTDGLTGLFNHRVFQERLKTEVARHVRYSRSSLSLLMIDIDHFKSINDQYGHQTGDKVLKEIAKTFERMVRGIVDVAARYGGEEFVIILPETTASDALIVSERLRDKIACDGVIADNGDRIQVTVSIGMANCPDDAKDKDDLIRCADTALYFAKRNGRNRSVRYETGMSN